MWLWHEGDRGGGDINFNCFLDSLWNQQNSTTRSRVCIYKMIKLCSQQTIIYTLRQSYSCASSGRAHTHTLCTIKNLVSSGKIAFEYCYSNGLHLNLKWQEANGKSAIHTRIENGSRVALDSCETSSDKILKIGEWAWACAATQNNESNEFHSTKRMIQWAICWQLNRVFDTEEWSDIGWLAAPGNLETEIRSYEIERAHTSMPAGLHSCTLFCTVVYFMNDFILQLALSVDTINGVSGHSADNILPCMRKGHTE